MRIIKTTLCCCWNIVNAALFFVLLLQIAVGVGIWWLNSSHSRELLKQKINTALEAHRLHADWSSVEIEWDGRIYFKNLIVKMLDEDAIKLELDNVLISLDVKGLILGNPFPQTITYDFASIYLVGEERDLLLRITGLFNYSNGGLAWETPAFLLDGIPLRVEQSIDVPLPLTTTMQADSAGIRKPIAGSADLYGKIAAYRQQFRNLLSHARQPNLRVTELHLEGNRLVAPFSFTAERITYDRHEARHPRIEGLVTYDLAGADPILGKLAFSAESLKSGDLLAIGPLSGTLFHKPWQNEWEIQTHVSGGSFRYGSYPEGRFTTTFGQLHYVSNDDAALSVSTTFCGQKIAWDAQIKEGVTAIETSAVLYPDTLIPLVWDALNREPLKELAPMRLVQPIRLSATGSLDNETKRWHADFRVATREASYATLHVAELSAQGHLDNGHLKYASAMAATVDSQAHADWTHEDPTKWFSLQISGFIVPEDINPVMLPWWERVFHRIEIFDPSTYANVRYSAESFDSLNSEVIGYVNGKSAFYCGYQLSDVELSIWRRPGFLRLMDLSGSVDGGTLAGEVGWLYPRMTGDGSTVNTFAIKTDYAGPAWKTIADDVWQVLEELPITGTPKVEITAKLTESPAFKRDRVEAFAKVDLSSGSMEVKGLPLQSPRFTVAVPSNGLVDVTIDYAELAEGELTGIFNYEAESKSATADLVLHKAGYAAVQHTLATINGEPSSVPLNSPGELDFSVQGKFPLDDLAAIHGQGQVAIRGAELQTIRMLGGLSRALEKIGLGATTIRFTDAQATFAMKDERMQFSKLELTGANNRMEATGSYHLRQKTVDMELQLFLLSENQGLVKAIVGGIMRPITFATRIRLMGTLKEPEWRLLLDPRNLFTPPGTGQNTAVPPQTPAAP